MTIFSGLQAAYYFGCWNGRLGHYLVDQDVVSLPRAFVGEWFPLALLPERLDGDFQPGSLPGGRPRGFRVVEQTEGDARLTHVAGWTVLSFWDRSVDHRGNSHSTFVMPGEVNFAAATALARSLFPSVWARFPFTVRLVEVTTIGL